MSLSSRAELMAAMGIDALVGDPKCCVHPVDLIAKFAHLIESYTRPIADSEREFILAGTIVSSLTVCTSFFVAELFSRLGPVARVALMGSALAGRSLLEAGDKVEAALDESLEEARSELSQYVGRDTSQLDQSQVSAAIIESLAENTCDGYVAPLFWGAFGSMLGHGPAFMWAYKAASTLDSLYGYRDEKNEFFGRSAAKLDDLMAYIPARITGVSAVLAAALLGYDYKQSARCLRQDHAKHESPNAAWSEAAFAGALDRELGGSAIYDGREVHHPSLNGGAPRPYKHDISSAKKLCFVSCALASGVLCLCLAKRR